MQIGKKQFDIENRTYIMGILNVTPDSFYDGGAFCDMDTALHQAEKLVLEGADIIDIGGESTRPGATPIGEQEEIERTADIVLNVKNRFGDIPISIDTYKASVAKVALDSGADMVNDIWGLRHDKAMAAVVADLEVPVVLMHNHLMLMQQTFEVPKHSNFFNELCNGLKESMRIAKSVGIKKENIILDPGIGFGGKTLEQNLACIAELGKLKKLGFPILIGVSNKSVIGNVLGVEVGERLYGTLGANMAAVAHGAAFIRVHDVRAHRDALTMWEMIKFTQ